LLLREKEAADARAREAIQKAVQSEATAKLKDEELRRTQREREAIQVEAQKARQREEEAQAIAKELKSRAESQVSLQVQNLKKIQAERDRYAFLMRLWLGLFIGFVGIAAILILPAALSWQWLEQHPNKLGLYCSSIMIIVGLAWGVIDKVRRKFAYGSLVLGAILVLVEIIGT
jgi:hypothetical protein